MSFLDVTLKIYLVMKYLSMCKIVWIQKFGHKLKIEKLFSVLLYLIFSTSVKISGKLDML